MSNEKNLSAEDLDFKGYVASIQDGSKFLRRYTKQTENTQPIDLILEPPEDGLKIYESRAKPKSKLKKKTKYVDMTVNKNKFLNQDLGTDSDNLEETEDIVHICSESIASTVQDNTIYKSIFDLVKYNNFLEAVNYVDRYIMHKTNEVSQFSQIIGYEVNKFIAKKISNNNDSSNNELVVLKFDDPSVEIYLLEYAFEYNAKVAFLLSKFLEGRFKPLVKIFDESIWFTVLLHGQIEIVESYLLNDINETSYSDETEKLFLQSINQGFIDFLKRHEWMSIKHNFSQYELYEVTINNKYYLMLNYNEQFQLGYFKSYQTGLCSWKPVNELNINKLKGRAIQKSLFNLNPSSYPHFYQDIKFENLEHVQISNNIENIIFTREIYESIIPDIECTKCTYKIDKYEYNLCNLCNNFYHRQCLLPSEQAITNNHWICHECKPCTNCMSNSNEITRLFCTECSSCYHYECINPYIQQLYPDMLSKVFRCERCLKCEQCGITIPDLTNDLFASTISWSKDLKICSNCEKRFELNEYCPICHKLWIENSEIMVLCNCKLWVHKDCDRILTDQYFQKISKATYYCPDCRVSKKQKDIKNILNEFIKQDKNGYFYHPVDPSLARNYEKIIKRPMCFKFIEDDIKRNIYLEEPQYFLNDLKLIFENATSYNMPNHRIHKDADMLLQYFFKRCDKDILKLNQLSLEYYLFDYNDPVKLNKDDKERILLNLEEIIRVKFINRNAKPSNISHLQSKLNEYNISWPFIQDYIEKNNSPDTMTVNNFDNMSMQSEMTVSALNGSNIIKPEEELQREKINNIGMSSLNDEKESIRNQINNLDTLIPNFNPDEMLTRSKTKIRTYSEQEILVDELPELDITEKESIEEISDQLKITVPLSDIIEIPIDKPKQPEQKEDIEMRIVNEQTKPKDKKSKKAILKTSDFQQELDCYNSNFEINKKTIRNNTQVSSANSQKNIAFKMEINENNENTNLELEEEDNTLKTFESIRRKDNKLSMLYLHKAKFHLQDKALYDSYIDVINSFIALKEDKKKKSSVNVVKDEEKPRKISESASEYEAEPQIQQFLKKKKGRPKLKVDDNIEKVTKLKRNTTQYVKKQISQQSILKTPIPPFPNENRLKTDEELYDENINTKSLLPLPTFIYFSDPSLIFESNCYLCGSFDDNHLMLSCSVCFERFHTYCISNTDMLSENIDVIKGYEWKCQNCKFCEVCHLNNNDQVLLYCDSCDRAIHTYCLKIPLDVVPMTSWKCLSCSKCLNCGTNEYYKQSFPRVKNKDYSKFTRNFNYCYECGLRIFYLSMCSKCNLSVSIYLTL
jgi:hypothetical protein